MSYYENRSETLVAVIVGVSLIVGLTLGGYFFGTGCARFKSDIRTVTVKGMVEKDVKADQAIWVLRFSRASKNIKDALTKISSDRAAAIDFLKNHRFNDGDISQQPISTIDKLAREYGQNQANDQLRYVVTSSVQVTTTNIDLVTKALGATEELLKSGVLLNESNPRYIITTFNSLRPQLLAEATKNARLTAQQFASDSGAKVGKIRSANQGTIQIFGSDGNDESDFYSPTSTPSKKIQFVSTFEFELQ
jgi:uncharacterized protein